jgi:hypothetical protein
LTGVKNLNHRGTKRLNGGIFNQKGIKNKPQRPQRNTKRKITEI